MKFIEKQFKGKMDKGEKNNFLEKFFQGESFGIEENSFFKVDPGRVYCSSFLSRDSGCFINEKNLRMIYKGKLVYSTTGKIFAELDRKILRCPKSTRGRSLSGGFASWSRYEENGCKNRQSPQTVQNRQWLLLDGSIDTI